MIPIEKNIIVVDENGAVFESTWLKRANGLVKKGRARWLDEQTICLACPPEQMEDNEMENNGQTEAITAHIEKIKDGMQPNPHLGGLTIEGLLDRMDAIRKEMVYMSQICDTMENITNQGGEDEAGKIAQATSQAFVAREATCQQQLRFLEKIYDDYFSAPSEEAKKTRTRMILDSMNDIFSALDYSEEYGNGNIEALKVLKELYSELLKQD